MLYLSNIHPSSPANYIPDVQLIHLVNNIHSVVEIAVKANANMEKFPDHWIFHKRWDIKKVPRGDACSSIPIVFVSDITCVLSIIGR